jgi:hypothetical protein
MCEARGAGALGFRRSPWGSIRRAPEAPHGAPLGDTLSALDAGKRPRYRV